MGPSAPRVVNIATGIDAGGNEDHLVELVKEENGVQEWNNMVEEFGKGEGGGRMVG